MALLLCEFIFTILRKEESAISLDMPASFEMRDIEELKKMFEDIQTGKSDSQRREQMHRVPPL